MGTQQSGVIDLKIADLGKDGAILQLARDKAGHILEADPDLSSPDNQQLKAKLAELSTTSVKWSSIS
jgi:ATP-dependent DNA helicase RecG